MMFMDFVNGPRGGIKVGGKKYGIRWDWVGDAASSAQVTNATAHAAPRCRC